MLYTDRLDEVCDAAQQAIDAATDAGYRVKAAAQALVDKALLLEESHPKKAVALCRDAYRKAAFATKLD